MDQCIVNKLKEFDQFGAVYKHSIHQNSSQYKSTLGGLVSIILYGLSFAYFLYYLVLWNTDQLLPKITNTSIIENSMSFDLQSQIASFYMRKTQRTSGIDPLNPKALILQPILHIFQNNLRVESKALYYNTTSELTANFKVILDELRFAVNLNNQSSEINLDYLLTFGECQTNYLFEGWQCAPESTVKSFWEQPVNAIVVESNVKQFNTQIKQIQEIGKSFYSLIDMSMTYYAQNLLKVETVSVDTGFLFQNQDSYSYVSNVETISQQLSLSYFNQIFNCSMYLAFAYKLDTVQNDSWIEYPKVSEILADIGSIVSIILFFSYLVILNNEKKLEKQLLDQVILTYYPEFKHIKFIKNWFGKIIEVYNNDKLQNFEKFFDYYKNLQDVAKLKLTITNQIYEISRIQFILQSLQDKKLLTKSHLVGIKLKEFEYQKLSPQMDRPSQLSQNNSNQQIVPASSIQSNRDNKDQMMEMNNLSNVNVNASTQPEQIKKPHLFLSSHDEPNLINVILDDKDFNVFSIPIQIEQVSEIQIEEDHQLPQDRDAYEKQFYTLNVIK